MGEARRSDERMKLQALIAIVVAMIIIVCWIVLMWWVMP